MGKTVLLCHAKRTPIGSFQGALARLSAPQLGAAAIRAVLADSGVPPASIQEVIMGCVLTAGTGQAPARQAALGAGLPNSTQALTVNKVCSSGLKAVMLASNAVRHGDAEAVIAGGMESMSRAPYLLPSLRAGARLGNAEAVDSIVFDGLWDPYQNYHMGNAAELCAREKGFSREAQDAFAIESYSRAQKAVADGIFRAEIVPVEVGEGKGAVTVADDEEPGKAKLEKIPSLKPVFQKDGTVTAANASSINDGAAAMLVCSEAYAERHQLLPLARVVSQGWHAQAPEWFTTAPIGAVEQALSRAALKTSDVSLFEINEAFAAVSLACNAGLGLDPAKVNISGGAVALGHPIGASGARILTTLLYGLRRTGGRLGVAAICNGGGEATAMVVESLGKN